MSRKNINLQKEEHSKEELESLLNEMDSEERISDLKTVILDAEGDVFTQKASRFMDFDKIKEDADVEANETVDSIVDFYIQDSIYDERRGARFLKSKTSRDKMTLSNIIFQMKTAEHAIKRLLEEIDAGNLHPRQFEVLAALQKSKMDIIKHLAFVQIQMENNYKTIRQEQEHLSDTTPNEDELSGGFGSKNMIKRLKNGNQDEHVEVKIDDVKLED